MPFWQDSGISIILLADDEQADVLLPVVRKWTGLGLLSPAVWVRPSQVRDFPSGPPEVDATVIGPDERGGVVEREVDLFAMLAQQSVRLVRIVKLRAPLHDATADRIQDLNSEKVIRYIQHSMPLVGPDQSTGDEAVEVIDFSLICAPTEVQLDDRLKDAEAESALVLVASPEDRAMPGAGDAFVRDNERFPGFVVMHTAAAAALWRGIPRGTLELVHREGSAAQGVWIQRVFARGVLTRGIAKRAAIRLLRGLVDGRGRVLAAGVPIAPEGTTLIPTDHADRYVTEMVDTAMALDEGALAFHNPASPGEPPAIRVSFLAAIAGFLRFSVGKFARIPHWIGLWAHDVMARQVIKSLQDKDSLQQIVLLLDQEPDQFDRNLLMTARRIADANAPVQVKSSLGFSTQATAVSGSTRLWPRLRQLVFGALDGGEQAPEGGFVTVDSRRSVFESIDPITPDPGSTWSYPNPPEGFPSRVTWSMFREDPGTTERLQEVVDKAKVQIELENESLADLTAQRGELAVVLDEVQKELMASGDLRVRADGRVIEVRAKQDAADEELAEREARLEPWRQAKAELAAQEATVAEQQEAVHEAERHSVEVESAFESFSGWVESLEGTFVLRLGARLKAVRAEAKELLDAAAEYSVELPEMNELLKLRKRFHLTLILSTSIIGVITTLLALFPWFADWRADLAVENGNTDVAEGWRRWADEYREALPLGMLLLYAVILLLIVWISAAAAYYRRWSSLERRVQLADHAVAAHNSRLRALHAEVARLESLHAQTSLWLDIMSRVLDRPWVIPADWLDEEQSVIDTESLPFALKVAHAVESSGMGEDRLLREAATKLMRKGWRSGTLRDVVTEIAEKLGEDRARLNLDMLDADQPDAPNHSTSKVRQYLDSPDVLQSIAARHLTTLVNEVQPILYRGERTRVEPIAREHSLRGLVEANSTTKGWLEFMHQPVHGGPSSPTPLSALGISLASQQEGHHQDVQSFVVASESVVAAVRPPYRDRIHLEPAGGEAADVVDTLIRVDVAGPVPLGAIHALYRGQRRLRVAPEPVTDSSTGI